MREFLIGMATVALEAWRAISAGRDAEEVKREARDRADVHIDKAIAKRRLRERKSK